MRNSGPLLCAYCLLAGFIPAGVPIDGNQIPYDRPLSDVIPTGLHIQQSYIRDDRYSGFGIRANTYLFSDIRRTAADGEYVIARIGYGAEEGIYRYQSGRLYDPLGANCRADAPDIAILGVIFRGVIARSRRDILRHLS